MSIARQHTTTPTLLESARVIIRGPSFNRTKTGGYDIKPGERVLLVVSSLDDQAVVDAIVEAVREIGSRIDVVTVDIGRDREIDALDEPRSLMHNVPRDPDYEAKKDGALGKPKWATRLAEDEKYDLLIMGTGGFIPKLNGPRWEGIPFANRATFGAAGFPWPLWDLINQRTWDMIWTAGRGGTVHLTDPEGTDLRFTLMEEFYDERYVEACKRTGSRVRFNEKYYLGHQYGRPTPPFPDHVDGDGVIAGTQNHNSAPYPHIKVFLERNQVVRIEGGGVYGDTWREYLELTKDIQYPEYPRPGLFWWWEGAIGTHPKMARARNAWTRSGNGAGFERLRSGIMHLGIGTANIDSPSEQWALKQGLPYGHMHVHCNFPTYEITTKSGEKVTVIDKGHLTALDHPDVIAMAENYGDPAEILREDWWPPVPGISVPGDYWKDYAPDPLAWLKEFEAGGGWSGSRPE